MFTGLSFKMILLVMNYGNYCFGPLKWFKVKSNVLHFFLRSRYFLVHYFPSFFLIFYHQILHE